MKLPCRTLGRTGEEVTALGLGGEGVLRTFGREEDAYQVIRAALEAGIRYFESARAYSGSEAYLGQGSAGLPGADFSHQQVPRPQPGRSRGASAHHPEKSADGPSGSVAGARCAHQDDLEAIGAPGGALEAFYRAKEQGKTRFIGVTGHHDPGDSAAGHPDVRL